MKKVRTATLKPALAAIDLALFAGTEVKAYELWLHLEDGESRRYYLTPGNAQKLMNLILAHRWPRSPAKITIVPDTTGAGSFLHNGFVINHLDWDGRLADTFHFLEDYADTLDELVNQVCEELYEVDFWKGIEFARYLYRDMPVDLSDMLTSPDYVGYVSDKTGNDMWINDPERKERIESAAENGADGSTHAESIEDMNDYVSNSDFPQWIKTILMEQIDFLEKYHDEQGTLNRVIG